MQFHNNPFWRYWEWQHRWFLRMLCTEKWHLMQGGHDGAASKLWCDCMDAMELDRKARLDLFLLASDGLVGRCEANRIMWELLARLAPQRPYADLSHKVTSMVTNARFKFDRPPKGHVDLNDWFATRYTDERLTDPWNPRNCPQALKDPAHGNYYCNPGPGDEPLPPPNCWIQGPAAW